MKPVKSFIAICAIAFLLPCTPVYSQCHPECTIYTNPIPRATVEKYMKNYANDYRNTTAKKKTHSISVDFSREGLIEFYKKNFIDLPGIHSGVNVHFVTFNSPFLPGHKDSDQIGLMLLPSDSQCKTNSRAYNLFNNSFNQTAANHINTPFPNSCNETQFLNFKNYYATKHRPGAPKKYTEYVHFDSTVFTLIYNYLINNPNYKGIRIDFGSYNLAGMACKQADPKQITLFISPVYMDGSANYESFYKFIEQSYTEIGIKNKILSTLNHGELCPDGCPEEGN